MCSDYDSLLDAKKPEPHFGVDDIPLGLKPTFWPIYVRPFLRRFLMLTVNADDHEFMRNFHKPEDEKRMVVILHEDEYDEWINETAEDARHYLRNIRQMECTIHP